MLNKEKALNWRKFLSNSPQWDFRTNRITPQGNSKSLELKKKKGFKHLHKSIYKTLSNHTNGKKNDWNCVRMPEPQFVSKISNSCKGASAIVSNHVTTVQALISVFLQQENKWRQEQTPQSLLNMKG